MANAPTPIPIPASRPVDSRMAMAPIPIPIPASVPAPKPVAMPPQPVAIPPTQINPPEILLLGDPAQGGFRGLNTCGSNNDLAWGQSPNMYNYLVSNTGLAKRKGCVKDNAAEIGGGAGATGLHRHYNGSAYVTYMKVGTDVYQVAAAGPSTSRLTGLAAEAEVEFESWLGSVFCADGVNLYSATDAAFSAVAWLDEDGNDASGWGLKPTPAALVLHKEHLWWFDKNSSRVGFTVRGYSNRIFEDTLNAGNYGSWVICDADDGQYLTALVRMPMADALMAFKREKSFFIEGDFDSVSNTLVVRPGVPSGAYDQKGVAVGPDGFVYWYGPDGIWQYRHDVGPICISRNKDLQLDINAILQEIPFASRAKCCMSYDSDRRYLLFFCPSAGSSYNDLGLAYDTVKREWMQIRGWNVARICEFEDGSIHAGWSNSGYVKKLFTGDNDDGADIDYYYETKYYGVSGVEGILDSIRARTTAGYYLKVKWESDSGTGINGEIEFSVDEAPAVWGDRDNPGTITGALHWGDRDNPGTIPDSTWGDRNAKLVADFASRVDAGQRFREIKFIFEGSSSSPHALDFVEARYYQKRLVV